MENGKLKRNELARVYHPQYQNFLARKPAAGINSINLYLWRKFKIKTYANGPNSDYRNYATQVKFKQIYGNNAATPGTSNHGLGKATDRNFFKLPYIRNIIKYGGWGKTDALWEPWHFNVISEYKYPDPGINPRYPLLTIGSGGYLQRGAVKELQKLLKRVGFSVNIDGSFGKRTEIALKNFQKVYGYSHGKTTKHTWVQLRSRRQRRKVKKHYKF